jgi:hypothetical protein
MLRWALGLAIALAAAAFVTRPSEADVEEALRAALYQRLFTEEIDAGREMLGNAAIIACRIDPSTCFEILREGLEVTYEDRVLYVKATVEGFGRRAECWGAFGRFTCPGGFEPPPEG